MPEGVCLRAGVMPGVQPEAKALVELVSFSYPWQYSQNAMAKSLWCAAASVVLLPPPSSRVRGRIGAFRRAHIVPMGHFPTGHVPTGSVECSSAGLSANGRMMKRVQRATLT